MTVMVMMLMPVHHRHPSRSPGGRARVAGAACTGKSNRVLRTSWCRSPRTVLS